MILLIIFGADASKANKAYDLRERFGLEETRRFISFFNNQRKRRTKHGFIVLPTMF